MKNCNDVELYRVRKSWNNIASQKGVFFILENAVRAAKKYSCNVYDNDKNCVWNYKEEKLCLKLH